MIQEPSKGTFHAPNGYQVETKHISGPPMNESKGCCDKCDARGVTGGRDCWSDDCECHLPTLMVAKKDKLYKYAEASKVSEWEERWFKYVKDNIDYIKYSHTNPINVMAIIDFIRTEIAAAEQRERQAWLEGKRCSECGKPKIPHPTWSLCDDCI